MIGRLSTSPLHYRCLSCKMPQVLTAQQWNRLPETAAEPGADEGGAPLLQLDSRRASPLLSPTAGKLLVP